MRGILACFHKFLREDGRVVGLIRMVTKKIGGSMPHPKHIHVDYDFSKTKDQVVIDLSAGTKGTFVWHGKAYELIGGHQTLSV